MQNTQEFRVFTIEEANQAIEEVSEMLPALRRQLREMQLTEDRLQVLDLICNRSVTMNNPDLDEYLELKIRYHDQVTGIEKSLLEFATNGFLLKDLDKGVVHFIAKRGEDFVLLCWNEGEDTISHWHELADEASSDEEQRITLDDWESF